jgi:transcriptional regulator with XRE-family HTH domain
MLSLKTETDVLAEVRDVLRATRMSLSWRQDDLAGRSGVAIATLRRFEKTGRIGFLGLARLMTTLGLTDRFLSSFRTPVAQPKDIGSFMAAAPAAPRRRAPNRIKTT